MNTLGRGIRLATLALAAQLAPSLAAAQAETADETETRTSAGQELGASTTSKEVDAKAEQPAGNEDAGERNARGGEVEQPEPGEADAEAQPDSEAAEVFLPSEAISEDAAVPFPADI